KFLDNETRRNWRRDSASLIDRIKESLPHNGGVTPPDIGEVKGKESVQNESVLKDYSVSRNETDEYGWEQVFDFFQPTGETVTRGKYWLKMFRQFGDRFMGFISDLKSVPVAERCPRMEAWLRPLKAARNGAPSPRGIIEPKQNQNDAGERSSFDWDSAKKKIRGET
ncbi:MAG TPA: hypothetical protein VG733_02605, partial [Chthoniobacteraceae bacterium]|nr:hypothetical protein [Chthoniobacteraceae bacterium]